MGVSADSVSSEVHQLACRIQRDIARRGLGEGDPYLTLPEVARLLGVRTQRANEALRELSRQGVIVRRRGRRPSIGPDDGRSDASGLDTVHFLMPSEFHRLGHLEDDLLVGFHRQSPGVSIQLNFFSLDDPLASAWALVEQIDRMGTNQGVVLIRAPRELQHFFEERSIPTAIYGTPFPGVTGLPWIDRDQKQSGQLLADFVLDAGMRRIHALFGSRWLPGTYHFLNGVNNACLARSEQVADYVVHSLPAHFDTLASELGGLIADHSGVGLICHNLIYAELVWRVIREAGRVPGRDVALAVAHTTIDSREDVRFPHTRPTVSAVERGEILCRMLSQWAGGHRIDPQFRRFEVELRLPAGAVEPHGSSGGVRDTPQPTAS